MAGLVQRLALTCRYLIGLGCLGIGTAQADDWPRWRGPDGSGVSQEAPLPLHWSKTDNIRWQSTLPGEGSSSPIVWKDHVFLTAALDHGKKRLLLCLDRQTGKQLWRHEVADNNPERTSAVTGHAAATPVTDGQHVVACFGNAGVVCCDFAGKQRWHQPLGEFESELGFASSPILHQERVLLVCDHDGDRFSSFDSFLLALDVRTGKELWKTPRPGLFRSWATPLVVAHADKAELIVNGQEEVRAYDPATGKQLWNLPGLTTWVTPSPVFGLGLIFATSGRNGPVLAVRPGGAGEVRPVWRHATGGPYVCSPLLYGECLLVLNEQGIVTCCDARTGNQHYRERLEGKFTASPVAGDGKVYLTNEAGLTFVLRTGPQFEVLARNRLDEYSIASPALAGGELLLRTERRLVCIAREGR